jgi:DeoR family transcriptional regulator of aga operon
VNIAMELARAPSLRVLLTGGFVSGSWFSILGPTALETIGKTEIDIAFIGVDGIDLKAGVTALHVDEADVNATMIRQAKRNVAVCDRSKLEIIAPAFICPLSDLDYIVTDSGADEVFCRALESNKLIVSRV